MLQQEIDPPENPVISSFYTRAVSQEIRMSIVVFNPNQAYIDVQVRKHVDGELVETTDPVRVPGEGQKSIEVTTGEYSSGSYDVMGELVWLGNTIESDSDSVYVSGDGGGVGGGVAGCGDVTVVPWIETATRQPTGVADGDGTVTFVGEVTSLTGIDEVEAYFVYDVNGGDSQTTDSVMAGPDSVFEADVSGFEVGDEVSYRAVLKSTFDGRTVIGDPVTATVGEEPSPPGGGSELMLLLAAAAIYFLV
jgi:hypothetical protein